MFKKSDPNSYTAYIQLFDGQPLDDKSNRIGYLIAEYQVSKYDNVQTQNTRSWNNPADTMQRFILHCAQRIVIINPHFLTLAPIQVDSSGTCFPYENYPALIETALKLTGKSNAGVSLQLLEYSPKTVNTKVQSSGSVGIGSTNAQSSSVSNTVGSSTAQTNSYSFSVNASIGVTGDAPSGSEGVSATEETSTTSTSEQSRTSGSEASSSRTRDASDSSSMSIKDWGAYSTVNPVLQEPAWIFGQEYPWDAILCRLTDGTTNPNPANPDGTDQLHLLLPDDMLNRLFVVGNKDTPGPCLYPPSQLSMFGINFVTKATWLVSVDFTGHGVNSDVDIEHDIYKFEASHSVVKNVPGVYLDKVSTQVRCDDSENNGEIITGLNLLVMALDALGASGQPAIIGFTPNKFIVPPSTGPFKIASGSNTLLIEDTTTYTGKQTSSPQFSASPVALSAGFPAGSAAGLSITLYFKVIDSVNDYNLYMKHWVTGAPGAKLTFTINGDKVDALTKYVTALEAEGGENNLLTIALRNHDFSSVDYHDYLQLGLNSIQISIEPNGAVAESFDYQVRAVSIERV